MPPCLKCGTAEDMVPLRGTAAKKFYRCEKCRTEYSANAGIGPLMIEREEPASNEADKKTIEGISVNRLCKSLKSAKASPSPLAPYYAQYTEDANGFEPERDITLSPTLDNDAYRLVSTPWGVRYAKMRPETDELYRFAGSTTEEVLGEIDKFWGLKDDYDALGLMHNRGIILHGPPGSGKTASLHQAAEMVVDRGDVVFYAKSVGLLIEALTAFREIEPDRKVVVVLEDADEFIGYSERDFLQLLDGEQSVNGILYLATTNYINRFPPRLLRSGRFDKKIYVGPPPIEGRKAYLDNKLKDIETDPAEIDRLAAETDGLSFADLRELVTAVYALKEPVDDVLNRLTGQAMKCMKSFVEKAMEPATEEMTEPDVKVVKKSAGASEGVSADGGNIVPTDTIPECPACKDAGDVCKLRQSEGAVYRCNKCGECYNVDMSVYGQNEPAPAVDVPPVLNPKAITPPAPVIKSFVSDATVKSMAEDLVVKTLDAMNIKSRVQSAIVDRFHEKLGTP
jgi:hypothetical protein